MNESSAPWVEGTSALFIGKESPPLTRVCDLFVFLNRWLDFWLVSPFDRRFNGQFYNSVGHRLGCDLKVDLAQLI